MSVITQTIYRLQSRAGTTVPAPGPSKPTVGFCLNSKDRLEQTMRTVEALDACGGYQLIWNDGSLSALCQDLPYRYLNKSILKNADLVEANRVKGGVEAALAFSMKRLLDLGYDWCGLIENDVELDPGWLPALMRAIDLAQRDGLVVGAASVRNYRSRVMEYREGYTLNWAMGAGMILFSRPALEVIYQIFYRHDKQLGMMNYAVAEFYRQEMGIDVGRIHVDGSGRRVKDGLIFTRDWSYAPILYRFGFSSIGTIPSMALDLGLSGDGLWLLDDYVTAEDNKKGISVAEYINA